MTALHGLVLGIIQGLTEFLPVSSSGHLLLVPYLTGWPDQGLAFDAAIHLGTLAALLAYFRRELLGIVTGALSRRLAVLVIIATIPGGLAGVLFEKAIEARMRAPLIVAVATAVWGIVMLLADRHARPFARESTDPLARVGWAQALLVGCAQALALVPGTSRSGVTITVGLLVGLDRATAARFSFLLGIPIIGGAGLLQVLHLLRHGLPPGEGGALVAGLIAAAVSGWAAVWFLVNYLKRGSLLPFVVYRLALAAVILAIFL